jgi:branched-chain amino acid transport system ATP-binding protein
MLKVNDLDVAYDDYQVLWRVSLSVERGEVVCLLGPNGAGKSTLMNTISGLLRARGGSVEFLGERIDGLPSHEIVQRGLSHVLERRRVFPYLTVMENLSLGAYRGEAKKHRTETLEWVFELFPRLRERGKQLAHSLSGGEQQMLAFGRGLMSQPRLLMVDEPFLGLSPQFAQTIIQAMEKINQAGVSVLFIEQNVQEALEIAGRAYVLESGRVALQGAAKELLRDERMREVYLGVL